ncbi:hypothetical protein G6F68_018923 [Rhizopus microsporus]|nr:hypothetical protein G6F68_018923 [Rhizopus microsporus]
MPGRTIGALCWAVASRTGAWTWTWAGAIAWAWAAPSAVSNIPRHWSLRSLPSRPSRRNRPTCPSTRMYSPRPGPAAIGTRAASSWKTHWW